MTSASTKNNSIRIRYMLFITIFIHLIGISCQSIPTDHPESSEAVSIYPISVTKTSLGDGYASLDVKMAIANTDTVWHTFGFLSPWLIVTAEGYTYTADYGTLTTGDILLPGFQMLGWACVAVNDQKDITFHAKVAENSSGYKLILSGYHDRRTIYNQPSDDVIFNTPLTVDLTKFKPFTSPLIEEQQSSNIRKIGENIDLENATLSIENISRTGDFLKIAYEFTNLLGGYGIEYKSSSYLIGDDGLMRVATDSCGELIDSKEGELELSAGPAQTVSGIRTFYVPQSVSDLYFVLAIKDPQADALFEYTFAFKIP
ncbi:MAG: hypothetical protein HYZ22_00590 [Chloroflexi bacterium]|nr:hypothetical protein [Chloroflexota bacterium]